MHSDGQRRAMNKALLEDSPGGVKDLFPFKSIGALSLIVKLLVFSVSTEEETRALPPQYNV